MEGYTVSIFSTLVKSEVQQSEPDEFTIVEHLGVPGINGLFNEVARVDCPHVASKQFHRFKWMATPLTASISLFKGEELIQFWSPTAL
jgi:hypothetical protein